MSVNEPYFSPSLFLTPPQPETDPTQKDPVQPSSIVNNINNNGFPWNDVEISFPKEKKSFLTRYWDLLDEIRKRQNESQTFPVKIVTFSLQLEGHGLYGCKRVAAFVFVFFEQTFK